MSNLYADVCQCRNLYIVPIYMMNMGYREYWTEVVPLLPGSCILGWTGALVFIYLPVSQLVQVPHLGTPSHLVDQMI